MHVNLRLFATLRDRAGAEQLRVELVGPTKVKAFLDQLADDIPALAPLLSTTLVAINQEYAFPEDTINDGDEVALFPPVSGGAADTEWPQYFGITQDTLDVDAIVSQITRPETGAVYVFLGAVRGITRQADNTQVTSFLLYEAYEPMAGQKLRQIAEEIRERFPKIQGIAIVQRIGKLTIGQTTVLVACAAGHRNDGCLEAARYGIDRLKEIVPIWKKEVSPTGNSWVEGHYHPTPGDVEKRIEHPATSDDSLAFLPMCPECGTTYPEALAPLLCQCGTPIEMASPSFESELIDQHEYSLWRYRRLLLPPGIQQITLGEGWTPLVAVETFGRTVHLKLEHLNPTGSFKDRGAAVLVSVLKSQGVTNLHDDSSGNAGAALAAYAARAGMSARLFALSSASPRKLAQIRQYGAQLTLVDGERDAATRAAIEASNKGMSVYGSHIYNPYVVLAYQSIAYELWEQLGYQPPHAIIMPVGNGTQLLGTARGFQDLKRAGVIDQLPRLIGVQAAACAPLRDIMQNKRCQIKSMTGHTTAEGIAIPRPARGRQIAEAIRSSGGEIITVSEDEIQWGVQELAHHGILAEPTSATVWPALKHIEASLLHKGIIVLSITGSGLKSPGL